MKIIIATLSALLLVLGINYTLLYIEHQNLQRDFSQQKTNYDRLAIEEAAACKNPDKNARLVNPYGTMINQPNANSKTLTEKYPNNTTSELDKIQRENLARTLEQKYSILLRTLNLSSQAQVKMTELLMERERILGTSSVNYFTSEADLKTSIEKQQAMIADIDRQITQLLTPEDAKKYELLKDSAYEQYQMKSFYEKLGDKNSLSEDKKNSLLLSKLEQKQEFAKLLKNSADAIEHASPDEKKYMADKMREALHDYKDNYLRTAKLTLNEEDFNILREYEQKQFDEIWQSLKAGWQIE